MTDEDLIALCAFEEADLEPDDGVAAVVRVIKNRIARHYQSDGTISNTIFHGNGVAFSWAAFAMVHGKYRRVADGSQQIGARADELLAAAKRFPKAWARVERISQAVMGGTYAGDDYSRMTDDTVLYLNPAISQAAWAIPGKQVCRIGHHAFFRA